MIWVIGGKGMLGAELCEVLEHDNIPLLATDVDVDITNADALNEFAKKSKDPITCIYRLCV